MNTRRRVYQGIICVFIFIFWLLSFNIYKNVKAEDTYGKITLTKTAVPSSNRGATVTLGVHTSELEQITTDIIILMDRSGSMAKTICVEYYEGTNYCKDSQYRLTVAKDQAKELIKSILPTNNKGNVKVGVVTFGTDYEEEYSTQRYSNMTSSQSTALNMINNIQLTSNNGTNVQAGLSAAKKLFDSSNADNKIIVLISDGEPTYFTLNNGEVCGDGNEDKLSNRDSIACKNSGYIPSTAAKAVADELKSSKYKAEIYAVGYGDSTGKLADFLTKSIASQSTADKIYEYNATDTKGLKDAISKIAANIKTVLATQAKVTDIIPEGFELTSEAIVALQNTYKDAITITTNNDGTTTIEINYKEINSIDGTYKIEYDVKAKDNYNGAMYTNEKAIFTATATEDNTFYQDKDIELEFDKPVVPIAPVTKDDDLTSETYLEETTYTIEKETIISNDIINEELSEIEIIDHPTLQIPQSTIEHKIVIDSVSCGTATINNDGDILYTPTEGCAGNPTIEYHVVSNITYYNYNGTDLDKEEASVTSIAYKGENNYQKSSTITLSVDRVPVTYEVKYLEQNTNKELVNTKTVSGYKNKDQVTEKALTGYESTPEGVSILKQYELVNEETQTITLEKDNNEIIFYYVKKQVTTDEPILEKNSTIDEITSLKNPIDYEINYYTEVEDFSGELTITLIDSLPHKIVENESTFHCSNTNSYTCTSEYDESKEIITYLIKYNVDTFETGEKFIVDFNLDIKLKYDETDFDGSETSIINRVSTHLKADELKIDSSSDKEIPADIKGTIIAEYVYLDENNNEVPIANGRYDYSETFKVGTTYETTKKQIHGYTFKEIRGNEKGTIKEETTKVTYIYTKDPIEITKDPTVIKKVPTGTELNRTNQEITYTIDYKTTVKNHDGDVTLKVIDTLEYQIEKVTVDTEGWDVSYDKDKTIIFTKNYHIHTSITQNNEVEIEEALRYTVKYKTFSAENDIDSLLINKAKGVISIQGTTTEGEETQEEVPINVKGNVLVYFKEKNTNMELKTSELQIENVKVGTTYQTTPASIGGYELDSNSGNTQGIVKETLTEVTYYYVRKSATPENPVLTKTGTTSITKVDELVKYNISYDAKISGYTGNLIITMVDVLPYPIDLSKSTIGGNYEYNEETQTIKWIILNETGITPDQTIPINFEVEASLSYIGIDATDDEFTNKVEIHIQDGTHNEDIETEEHKTLIDVKGNVIVKHIDANTGKEIKEVSPVNMSGKVGDKYITKPATINGYELITTKLPDNANGTYIDGNIYVNYFYKKTDIKVTDESIDKLSSTDKILSVKQKVDYQINYNAYVEYRGNVVVTIIDKLPYPIDESMSELSGGIYNEDDLTITWYETINDINTYLTSDKYHISIQKFISLRYKEVPSNDIVKNEVTAYIKTEEGKTDEATPDTETIPTEIKGNLLVEYIYIAENGEIKTLYSYNKTDYVGNTYTTEAKNFNGYTLNIIPDNANGKIKEELTRVTYFYTKTPAEIKENEVEKTASDVVKNINEAFNYNIKYKTILDKYIGNAKILLVDKLPYPIDITKSNLSNGIYDENNLTITWIKEYEVNTYENINNIIEFNINISLYYKELNQELDKVTNDISTKLYVDTINKPVESQDSAETKLEIKGTVISKYVDEFGNEILKPITITGFVGEKYQTSSQNIEGYTLSKINGSETGEYIDGEIEVIYIYSKNDIILPPNTGVNTSIKSHAHILTIITLLGLLISIKKIIKL